MATQPEELYPIIEARRHDAERVIDQFGVYRESYADWRRQQDILHQIARGDWHMVWPDKVTTRAQPKIPNYVVLASEHRARLVAEARPMVSCRPVDLTDPAKRNSEKRERIFSGYWDHSNVMLQIPLWALDLQFAGLAAVKVLPEFHKPIEERFPCYTRIDPRTMYPSPIFGQGPFIDDVVIATEETLRTVEYTYGVDLKPMMNRARNSYVEETRIRVLEFHSAMQTLVVAEPIYKSKPRKREFHVLVDEDHKLGKCPVTIGTRSSFDGVYRGDFTGVIAMMNTANKLMTLHIDSATNNVYPVLKVGPDVENPEDYGPGAQIHLTDNGAVFEYMANPPSPYDNYQVMRTLDASIRTGVLLPPSVTGDPNESVTSAAGIGATQSMPNAEVVAMQRDSLAPMLQAANFVAACGDQKWADTKKSISGIQRGAAFVEEYTPSREFKGNYTNYVSYGMGAGMDKVTLNVALLQNKGEGMISAQTAREKSPFVDDPIGEEKQLVLERLKGAALSAIEASAMAPPGDPRALTPVQIADFWDEVEKPDSDIKEAIRTYLTPEQAALTPTPETGPPALGSPGTAGAGEPQPPSFAGAPPIEELLGA